MNLSTLMNNTTESPTPIPQSVVVTVLVLTAVCLVAGTYGNARVCLLLARRRDLRKVPHFLLANLSVIGLLSSLLLMPIFIATAAKRYILRQQDSVELYLLCKIQLVLSFFCSSINAMTLSLMAMDRQDCIFRPLRRRLKTDNVKIVLLVVWCVALIIHVVFPILIVSDRSQCSPCSDPLTSSSSNSSGLYSAYITIFGTVFNVAAVVIMVITFLRIVKRLRSSPLPQSRSLHQRYESQITKLTYKTCPFS